MTGVRVLIVMVVSGVTWLSLNSANAQQNLPSQRRVLRTTAATLRPLAQAASAKGNWPSFRGPGAAGVMDGVNLPDTWDAKTGENILWRASIPGLAHSSPIVWGNRVFVTSAIASNADPSFKPGNWKSTTAGDHSSHRWVVYAIDRHSGAIVWERVASEGIPVARRHAKTSHAAPTPATDGRIIVASFGSQGVYAYDMNGEFRWKVDFGHLDVGAYDNRELEWGSASSPIIWNDTVFLQVDTHEDDFLIALNASTGETRWKIDRDEHSSWGTPTVIVTPAGPQLVTNAAKFIRSYDPSNGRELWRLGRSSAITAPTPFLAEDSIVVASGWAPERPLFVVRPSARGDITLGVDQTTSEAIVWSRVGRGPYMPTPVAYNGFLYVLANNGTFDAYNLKTGEEIYRTRAPHLGLGFSGSPVAADGKIYISSEDGEMMVIAAGPTFETLATNSMGEWLMATPALSGSAMYVRGGSSLFAIGRTPSGRNQ